MSLKDDIGPILQHINDYRGQIEYNKRLLTVFEGQLKEEVEASLREELRGRALAIALKRIPPINVLKRIIDKLSRVYNQTVVREAREGSKLPEYLKSMCFDLNMSIANQMLNLHKYVALEPYLEDTTPRMRVIPADRFLPYSDDPDDCTNMTHFIKFMGRKPETVHTMADGITSRPDDNVAEVDVYHVWTATEFAIILSNGALDTEAMRMLPEQGVVLTDTGTAVNPLGRIKFTYVKRSDFFLIPPPDTDTLDNTILIPKLLADLNYAVQFQSHSRMYGIDVNLPDGLDSNPDAFWNIKSDEGEGKNPRISVIKPEVDIEDVMALIKGTLIMWLESRNIKPGQMGSASEQRASGFAKIIDEADASNDRIQQVLIFEKAEDDYFELLDALLANKNIPKIGSIMRTFGDQRPSESDMQRLERVVKKLDNGLISKRQALREINPDLDDTQLAELEEEIRGETIGRLIGAVEKETGSEGGTGETGGSDREGNPDENQGGEGR